MRFSPVEAESNIFDTSISDADVSKFVVEASRFVGDVETCHEQKIVSKKHFFQPIKTVIFGHRGAGCSLPGSTTLYAENSIPSIQRAIDVGLEGVEIDVWLSKDEELVVFHGGGLDWEGLLEETTLCYDLELSIECYTLNELKELTLREAWYIAAQQGVCGEMFTDSNQIMEVYLQSNSNDLKNHDAAYTKCKLPCRFGSSMPTLKELLSKFYGKISFNVELKGTNPKIGLMVVSLAAQYPGAIVCISSFYWIPPSLSENHCCTDKKSEKLEDRNMCPNGYIPVDLLAPIIGNEENVPLGLLFNCVDSRLPKIEVIIDSLGKYKAGWACFQQDFWRLEGSLPDSSPLDAQLAKTISCSLSKYEAFSKQNHHNCCYGVHQLHQLVGCLHEFGIKVLFWWKSRGVDTEHDLLLHLDAGSDIVCPNSITMAFDIRGKRTKYLADSIGSKKEKSPVILNSVMKSDSFDQLVDNDFESENLVALVV